MNWFLLFDEIEKASDAAMAAAVRSVDKRRLPGRQPEGRFVTDRDLPDLEPRGQPDRGSGARRMDSSSRRQADNWIARKVERTA